MWSISEIKERGLFFMRKNYWKTVLVAFLIVSFLNGSSSSGNSVNIFNGINQAEENGLGSNPQLQEFLAEFSELIAIFAGVIVFVSIIGVILSIFLRIFVLAPFEVGTCNFMYRTLFEPSKLLTIFSGFKNNYRNTVKVMFFRDLYIFLWTLLFIIPGVIKSYEYRLVPYILSECPDMSKDDALRLSSEMMKGHKMHTFLLELSFIGWGLLTIVTCGILGIFFTNPYIYMTYAAHYDKMKFLYNEKFSAYAN